MEREESDKTNSDENKQTNTSALNERRSLREKKNKRSFSPDLEMKKKRKKSTRTQSYTSSSRPCDLLPDGEPFCCKLCKSPYVTNPHAKGVRKTKRSRHVPLPKKRLDSLGGEMLVCNACCQILDRQLKPKKASKELSTEERNKYLEDAKMFARSLAETLNEPDAEKLYCPVSVYRICGCLQKYIAGKDDDETALELRVTGLLDLMKEAALLREQKSYNIPEHLATSKFSRRRLKYIGYGNGHKKSKAFEEFVLEKRRILKEDMRLCERATQRILLYSNNFLHKKLKTEERPCRIIRTKGKAALGKLLDIDLLHEQTCCIDGCVRLSVTHPNLLKSWRSRAVSGQMEARKVIAEMLTPAGGYRLNCYQFISMVTGCALTTIGKVNNQIRETGGKQDPPEHGMKRVWTASQRNRVDTLASPSPSTSDGQDPQLVQSQSIEKQEVTVYPEISRTSQNQTGLYSSTVFEPTPQLEKIGELVKKKLELQQQQQMVQYQIQQTLNQHSALTQNTGWMPQLVGPLSQSSTFIPVGNPPQIDMPLHLHSVTNMAQNSPGQLQIISDKNTPVPNINIPVVGQLGFNYSQVQPVLNQFGVTLNQETANQVNFSPGQFYPVNGQSVCNSYLLQTCVEHNSSNLLEKQVGVRQMNYSSNQSQSVNRPLSISTVQSHMDNSNKTVSDQSQQVTRESSCSGYLGSDAPQSKLVSSQSQLAASQLNPALTTRSDTILSKNQPVTKTVLSKIDSIQNQSDFVGKSISIPVELTLCQLPAEKQGIEVEGTFCHDGVDSNALGKAAPQSTCIVIDQNGHTHYWATTFSPAQSQLFSVNNLSTTDRGIPSSFEILIPSEQQNDNMKNSLKVDVNSVTELPLCSVEMVDMQTEHQSETMETIAESQTDRQLLQQSNWGSQVESIEQIGDKNLDSRKKTSGDPIQVMLPSGLFETTPVLSSVSSGIPPQIIKLDIVYSGHTNDTNTSSETVSGVPVSTDFVVATRDNPVVVSEKELNDLDVGMVNVNKNGADMKRESRTKENCGRLASPSVTGTNYVHKNSEQKQKNVQVTSQNTETPQTVSLLSNKLTSNVARNYLPTTNIVNQNVRAHHDRRNDKSKELKKSEKRQHRSRYPYREQGFQKLQSKSGKVFLQSKTPTEFNDKINSSASKEVHVSEAAGVKTSSSIIASEETMTSSFDKTSAQFSERSLVESTEKTIQSCEEMLAQPMEETLIQSSKEPLAQSIPVAETEVNTENKTPHVNDKVKSKLRKMLNVPILPKIPNSAKLSPPELQPLQSSLFVMPPSSQNVTNLLHMAKSKVQVQPQRINSLPVSPVVYKSVSDTVSLAISPAFSTNHDNAGTTENERNLLTSGSHILRSSPDRNETLHGYTKAFSTNKCGALSGDTFGGSAFLSDGNELDLNETRIKLSAHRASGKSLNTKDAFASDVSTDCATDSSTDIITVGNFPPVFLQNIQETNLAFHNVAGPPCMNQLLKDQSLTLLKKSNGQSILALPFSHSLSIPQPTVSSYVPQIGILSSRNEIPCSASRSSCPNTSLPLSSAPNVNPDSEGENRSPSHLAELSSDVIQRGIQEELNLLKGHPD